jgi:hypothetical protein
MSSYFFVGNKQIFLGFSSPQVLEGALRGKVEAVEAKGTKKEPPAASLETLYKGIFLKKKIFYFYLTIDPSVKSNFNKFWKIFPFSLSSCHVGRSLLLRAEARAFRILAKILGP